MLEFVHGDRIEIVFEDSPATAIRGTVARVMTDSEAGWVPRSRTTANRICGADGTYLTGFCQKQHTPLSSLPSA
jgi:hypothetical protein